MVFGILFNYILLTKKSLNISCSNARRSFNSKGGKSVLWNAQCAMCNMHCNVQCAMCKFAFAIVLHILCNCEIVYLCSGAFAMSYGAPLSKNQQKKTS